MTGSDFASDGADTEPFLPVADNCLMQPIKPLAADYFEHTLSGRHLMNIPKPNRPYQKQFYSCRVRHLPLSCKNKQKHSTGTKHGFLCKILYYQCPEACLTTIAKLKYTFYVSRKNLFLS